MVETLIKVREHLSDPANWSSDGPATKSGRCLALVIYDFEKKPWGPANKAVAEHLSGSPDGAWRVHEWNDDPRTTHADVLRVLDEVITQHSGRKASS